MRAMLGMMLPLALMAERELTETQKTYTQKQKDIFVVWGKIEHTQPNKA